mmetsp:Transcript_25377/g.35579  ORF Transcript_25377/g.35579 Transcript_25377/m.35579 type:complete len:568 (+) Transcript_25377:76-1779(+)|eukprot:CAMPEP_0168556234 /NCGR_PEP_ID=MMETSP0413-20121227/8769_1 /TAXON_ID=136452 /ORGANISM="Filamoeba nolandi, Strain NC-AS-23-1" /LENGTH=567 /DNA_ID=CAMNT_0008587157 /DNA_START=75 /DNA_END=1778 /DNA_ORIENTATION=-
MGNTLNTDPYKGYDIVINIDSISKITRGWEMVSEKDVAKIIQNTYNGLVVSSYGNYDKGKTFVLTKIFGDSLSNANFAEGKFGHTVGLSFKFLGDQTSYASAKTVKSGFAVVPNTEKTAVNKEKQNEKHQVPVDKNRSYIVLDTAGFLSPIMAPSTDPNSEAMKSLKILPAVRPQLLHEGVEDVKPGSSPPVRKSTDKQPTDEEKSEIIKNAYKDKKATEFFLTDVIFELSDFIIMVTTDLTSMDQETLFRLKTLIDFHIESGGKENSKKVIVIHNFKEAMSEKEMRNLWEEQVLHAFQNISERLSHDNVDYLETMFAKHVMIANQFSTFGKTWNEKVFRLVRAWLDVDYCSRDIPIMKTVEEISSRLINRYMKYVSKVEISQDQKKYFLKGTQVWSGMGVGVEPVINPMIMDVGSGLLMRDAPKYEVLKPKGVDALLIIVELPGMDQDTIEIDNDVENNCLIITGEKMPVKNVVQLLGSQISLLKNVARLEFEEQRFTQRFHGRCYLKIRLEQAYPVTNFTVNASQLSQMAHGMLLICVPKMASLPMATKLFAKVTQDEQKKDNNN